MQHIKTLLVCMAATLLISCSKKEDEKPATPIPEPEVKKSHWILNGQKFIPTQIIERYSKSGYGLSVYKGSTLYASCEIAFMDSLKNAGSYSIGGVTMFKKQVYVLAMIQAAGTDSVFHSRPEETQTVKVTITPDNKINVEVPEIWVKNPHKPTDSCKFSGAFIEK